MEQTAGERRYARRYEIRLPLRYRVSERGNMPLAGSGTTCDLSTSGLSFRCRRPLPVGGHIEVLIDWPPRFGDRYPIELQITGFVVRNEGGRIGVRLNSHRFRVEQEASQPFLATA
jgi:hypothetical protein